MPIQLNIAVGAEVLVGQKGPIQTQMLGLEFFLVKAGFISKHVGDEHSFFTRTGLATLASNLQLQKKHQISGKTEAFDGVFFLVLHLFG